MNRAQLLDRLNKLDLSKEDYWLITGGAMVLYGLRPETGDIDLGCTQGLADALEAQGCPVTIMPDGTRKICLSDDVEIFEEWLYDRIEIYEGIPVISLNGLITMKRTIGREKDLHDIKLIEDHLSSKQAEAQALYELAMKHIYGDGVPEDNELAVKLLTQAHDMGHVEAAYNLGICYHYGYGTGIDLGKAYALYLESANGGYGKGMELVGRFYNRGIYMERDRKQAEYWLHKAMESSDPDAAREARKELARK